MVSSKKVLIATIRPVGGGVPAMVRSVIDCLKANDCDVTLAYYEPYSVSPNASVPVYKFFSLRRPTIVKSTFYDCDAVGVGCYFPELEFTNHWLNRYWTKLLDENDVHLVISGSCLAALPFMQKGVPFLGWIASDWDGDRAHRVKTFPWYRRAIDSSIISWFSKRIEQKIIRTNSLVALSDYTQEQLNKKIGYQAVTDVLPMAIDTHYFVPREESDLNFKIGFIGRFEDPRKNIELLIKSAAIVCQQMSNVNVFLVGDRLSDKHKALAKELGVLDNLTIFQYLESDALLDIVKQLDVFVLPSYQEGLCIAALEAMSCAVPVVSTRCGGPETFIEHEMNGLLVESNEQSMSDAIINLYTDTEKRFMYAENARETIMQRFSTKAHTRRLQELLNQKFDT